MAAMPVYGKTFKKPPEPKDRKIGGGHFIQMMTGGWDAPSDWKPGHGFYPGAGSAKFFHGD